MRRIFNAGMRGPLAVTPRRRLWAVEAPRRGRDRGRAVGRPDVTPVNYRGTDDRLQPPGRNATSFLQMLLRPRPPFDKGQPANGGGTRPKPRALPALCRDA